MSFLKSAVHSLREPLLEGRGIKVFRLEENAITNDQGRSCKEIHQQIAGFMEHAKKGKVFECGKCGEQFTVE